VSALPQQGAGRAAAVHSLRGTDRAWQHRPRPVNPAACTSNSSLFALFGWPGGEGGELVLGLVRLCMSAFRSVSLGPKPRFWKIPG